MLCVSSQTKQIQTFTSSLQELPVRFLCKVGLIHAAAVSFAACGVIFRTTPALVTQALKPYASLTYKNKRDKDSSGCRYFSFLHALVVTVLNFHIFFQTDVFDESWRSTDATPLMWRHSQLTKISLGISLGYFLLDAILVAWYLPAMGGWEMVTHHIAAFVSVFVTAFYREAHPYTLALLSTECTTPFINIRWLLEKMDWKGSMWYKVNGIGLLLSWIFVRIVMFVFFFHNLYHHRDQLWQIHWPVGVPLLVVPPLLAILNLLWFSKIAKGAIKLFFSKRPTEKALSDKAN